jgi:amino acid adenylation domain-containing protein
MILDEFKLSPLQEGMLFHHLSGDMPGVDIEQIVIGYNEPVDAKLLERAWRLATERHSMLRASFEWKQSSDPVQQVNDQITLSLEVRTGGEDEAGFQEFLTRDRASGFDLSCAPLMRLTLFEWGEHHYRLVWTVHHILLDGRAFILVLNDVEEFYQRLRRGDQVVAEPGPAFRPYIQWLQNLNLEGAKQFWANRFRGIAGPTPLLVDAQALDGAFSGYGEEQLCLSEETTTALREVAKRLDVTLNTIVMGVWGLLLSRYSGEREVLFGATKTTRRGSIADADAVAGLFLNTVPVRANLLPEAQFADALQELRAEWLSLRAYEHAPLTTIKEASGFAPSASLFDSLVVFENQDFHTALKATAECWKTREWHLLEQTNFPLTFAVYGNPEMLLKLEFDRSRFTNESARRILKHGRQLFESIAARPQQKTSDLTLLTPAERQQVLVEWNATEWAYPLETSLAGLVEAQVKRTPDAIAVVFGEQQLTYRELNERANQLAYELHKHGAGPDQLVGLCVERSTDMIVALLAIVKAGSGYLPLDPLLPAERLGYMLEDSGVRVLVTEQSLQGELPAFAGTTILLEDADWQKNGCDNLAVALGPEHLAYVIYTSGSTGKPKGVQVTRRALINLLWSMREWLQLTNRDRLLAVTTVSFDIAGADVWLPLLVGAQTVVASRESAADGDALRGLLERHDITFLQATPVTWRLLFDAGWRGKPNLQTVCTGEAMPPEMAEQLVPVVRRVWNLYGPTETTIWSTGYLVTDGREPILIGRPVSNTQCYILDAQGQPVPIGVTGELFIGGDGLARGYLNRPELTAEKFIPDPFRGGQARMYRTGDLARYWANGNIECLGRIDHQVKIRGYRIELGEIEGALRDQPEIKQAVVMAREDTPGDKRLVAYLVASPGMSPAPSEIRKQLKECLPDYMVPSAYMFLEEFPISPNGKIDRKALPAPDAAMQSGQADASEHALPRNQTEERIAAIFAQVLGVANVGTNEDFFDLGGHSLTATRVIALLNKQFGAALQVRVLFQASTVSQLAAVVEKQGAGQGDDWSMLIPIQPSGARPPLFCVARPNVNALGYLFLSRELGSDQPVYGLQVQLAEDPDLDFTDQQLRTTAAEYICAIRKVQPHGPYNFVGLCQGAYIAFEMVRQLEAANEVASFLGILDTWPDENTRYRSLFFADLALKRLRTLDGRTIRRAIDKIRARVSHPGVPDGHMITPVESVPPEKMTMVQKYWPGKGFRPPMCSCPITVFKTRKQFWFHKKDKTLGWGDRTRGVVTVRRIPGGHETLLRQPHVRKLALLIAEGLDGASRNGKRLAGDSKKSERDLCQIPSR